MRFYYSVKKKTVNRKYQVFESAWDPDAKALAEPQLLQLTSKQTADWFGVTPNQGNGLRLNMWVYIPRILRRDFDGKSLLGEYIQNSDVIAPYSIKTLRYFPSVDLSMEKQSQGAPPRFRAEAKN